MDDMPAYDPLDRSRNGGEAVFGETPFTDDARDERASGSDQRFNHGRDAKSSSQGGLFGGVQTHLLDLAETGKSDLVRNVDNVARMVREVTSQVEAIGFEPLSRYARQAAGFVDDLHGSIRDKDIEDLIDDGRTLVRDNPQIALLAAAAIGFIGARILKARG